MIEQSQFSTMPSNRRHASTLAALGALWLAAAPLAAHAQDEATDESAQAQSGESEAPDAAAAESKAPAEPAPTYEAPQAPLPAPSPLADAESEALVAPTEEVSYEEWSQDQWNLVKPQYSMVHLGGYARIRHGIFRRLDFGNDMRTEPTRRYPADADGATDFNSTNMRLRIEPRINVSKRIQVITTIDVLDNLVLGTTPNIGSSGGSDRIHVLADGQSPAVGRQNALRDSLLVKRAYVHLTILNEQMELNFGRMPDHFGLGMVANSGDCLDCDGGDVADRIALRFKIAGHLFEPMFDWISTGSQIEPFPGYQTMNAVRWDDAKAYGLRVQKFDHPEDIKTAVKAGETVLNYGAWVSWRKQEYDLHPDSSLYGLDDNGDLQDPILTPGIDSGADKFAREAAAIITGDIYGRLYMGRLRLSGEAAMHWGSFRDDYALASDQELNDGDIPARETTILQVGAFLNLEYELADDMKGGVLGVKGGYASGDAAPGFGALDNSQSQRGLFRSGQIRDTTINNFQFDPNFHVDRLVYRHIVGTVTDSWFVNPNFTFNFDQKMRVKFGGVYSQAMLLQSTPSCDDTTESGAAPQTRCRTEEEPNASKAMALELNGEWSYGFIDEKDRGSLRAAVDGAFAVPFGAFRNNELPEDQADPTWAWTAQVKLIATF